MTSTPPSTHDRVTTIVAITVSIFLILSVLGAYALAWTGKDPGDIWPRIFDVIAVLSGAVAGFIAGERTGRDRANSEEGDDDSSSS